MGESYNCLAYFKRQLLALIYEIIDRRFLFTVRTKNIEEQKA